MVFVGIKLKRSLPDMRNYFIAKSHVVKKTTMNNFSAEVTEENLSRVKNLKYLAHLNIKI